MAFQGFSKKLLRYFNGTIISTSFVPSLPICSAIVYLNLNEALKSAVKPIAVLLASEAVVLP